MAISRIQITTPRLNIRDFHLDDLTQDYVDSLNNQSHMRWSSQRLRAHTLQTSREYFASFYDGKDFLFALERSAHTSPVVGSISAHFSKDATTIDLGLFVMDSYSGQGLGGEAWCAVVSRLATWEGVTSLTASTARSNEPMLSIINRSGMRLFKIDESLLSTSIGTEDALRFRLAC